jgi:hypothetical protein
MPLTSRFRRLCALGAVVACAAAATALAADPGRAQEAGTTYTITYGNARSAMVDVAPKGLGRGRAGLGDQVILRAPVRRDGGVGGTITAVWTVGDARPVRIERAAGPITGVYHLDDGDIHFQAYATFDDRDTDHGTIVGGTGAYAGARGTLDSSASRDVLHLLP